ncbi:C40 family peptidase [Cellulomonas chengniuliangii]|uniref:C40 family peptidase n=1 Tax=Cellulomonas chengniuliangii TaxID=2968084 RepID=A0ABY5L1K5_9CELL|nr:C40 family peptidase [Cellulomonas chengniuliangii]MCC2307264.1 C40 family peptidase [Cellulomonas chengniuliangii]MCC2317840.1 C40 family peptidase [Cellulomonas chengniuliangii]UUI75943.1 C40 family peptidase [Cellulomonas chengniuliangii]
MSGMAGVQPSGMAGVQARIAELRQLVEPTAPVVASAVAASTSGGSSDASFAAALAALGVDPAQYAALAGGSSGSGAATGQGLVEAAKKYLGVPYVWGGETLDEGGLDCSGLVLRAMTDLGVGDGVPRTARQQMTIGAPVASLDQALPGDLLVFGGGTHIGIYVGDGQMIDAPRAGSHVQIRDVYATPTAIRRVLPQEAAVADPGVALSAALTTATAQRSVLSLMAGAGVAS